MDATVTISMERRECPECGIVHYVPKSYMEECRRNPNHHFYCPAGHVRHFSESIETRLRRERDQLKQQAARLEEEASQERVRAERAERATKRLKKRASAGTCPCCQRTFSNMAEHMKHQHPQFVAEGGAKVVPLKRA